MSLFLSRFRGLLEEYGKTQKEICADLEIRNQKLSNWKTGYSEPNFDDIIMLANYFDVSTDYLLGKSDDFGNISVKAETAPALPKESQELLDIFDSLDKFHQVQVLEYARYFSMRENATKNKKG